jgi:membrane protein implicated in regulation of membrane protease activity
VVERSPALPICSSFNQVTRMRGGHAVHEWQVWLVAALLLFVAEMLAPGFWLLSVAVGCIVAGMVSLVLPGVLAPVLSFAAGTLLSLVGIRPLLFKYLHPRSGEVKTNVDALVGKVGIVSEMIDPATGKGRVVVEGEDWRGAALMDTAIEPGTRVMVVRVEGAILYVDKEM